MHAQPICPQLNIKLTSAVRLAAGGEKEEGPLDYGPFSRPIHPLYQLNPGKKKELQDDALWLYLAARRIVVGKMPGKNTSGHAALDTPWAIVWDVANTAKDFSRRHETIERMATYPGQLPEIGPERLLNLQTHACAQSLTVLSHNELDPKNLFRGGFLNVRSILGLYEEDSKIRTWALLGGTYPKSYYQEMIDRQKQKSLERIEQFEKLLRLCYRAGQSRQIRVEEIADPTVLKKGGKPTSRTLSQEVRITKAIALSDHDIETEWNRLSSVMKERDPIIGMRISFLALSAYCMGAYGRELPNLKVEATPIRPTRRPSSLVSTKAVALDAKHPNSAYQPAAGKIKATAGK